MRLYEITPTTGPALTVFATSYSEAAGLYAVYWLTNYEAELPDLEVKERNPLWLGLDTDMLRDALALEVSGVGHFDADRGWRILPPNHQEEKA